MTSLRDIRQQFLKFFESHGHTVAPSSPLVPDNDPTLLFTNAGMVQFKDYFTGATTPKYPRAATSQKCVRAGGKHNDLDNVGYTARHHTFFEMLGNFSFGDYFKDQAIEHAWNLVTKDFGLDKDKLLVYDIDLFQNLIRASEELTGKKSVGEAKFSHRVIADHLRSCSFLMADGVSPSNEGRGYVLRRIMRRAMRHAHILGTKDPLMHRLVPALITEMGGAYGELGRAQASIEATFEQEEERFRRTLGRGTTLLEEATANLTDGDKLDGKTAFTLYDTFGFPLDLTQDALRARGISVDTDGFDKAMAKQKENSKAGGFKSGDAGTEVIWQQIHEELGPTEFSGHNELSREHEVVGAIMVNGQRVHIAEDCEIALVVDTTPFYAESGGQAGDKGIVTFDGGAVLRVQDVQKKAGDLHVHYGALSGKITLAEVGHFQVDPDNRKRTMANHSATHLMHEALRRVLGPHVTQKGQMVDGERIRFDISHGAAITREELAKVEDEVNQVIMQNAEADTKLMSPDAAIEAGAMALFGEKYGDEVRVLSLGKPIDDTPKDYSVELCGGTHVERTGDIALFKIVSEGAVAAGIRRVEAVTGEAARSYLEVQAGITRGLADTLKAKPEDVTTRVETLIAEKRQLEKDLSEAKKQLALGGAGGGASTQDIGGVKVMASVLDGVSGKNLRSMLNEQLSAIGSGIVAFVAKDAGKVAVAVAVTDDLTDKFSAVTLVNAGAEKVGGRGGGKPGMAQAGGSNVEGADDALAAIKAAIGA